MHKFEIYLAMGGKKKHSNQTQPVQEETVESIESNEKRFVNLLHVYTIYKQKFRRLSKKEFQLLLNHGRKGRKAAIALCKELMQAKEIPEELNFEKNVGYLSLPRLIPLIALLAERAEFKIRISLVRSLDFHNTPQRFKGKFGNLMVYGFWFLGRVIMDSLSVKDQVNRGNVFQFSHGDMGYWWAGVRILDWNKYCCLEKSPNTCYSFVTEDPPRYRHYTSRAIINMHRHPLYFLSELDWINYRQTIQSIKHCHVSDKSTSFGLDSDKSPYELSSCTWASDSVISFMSTSEDSINTLASGNSGSID